jgi:hypothetical protein
VAEQASVGIGVIFGQRNIPVLTVTLDTELIRFLFTLYLMELMVDLIGGQGRGAFFRGEVQKYQQPNADYYKTGIEQFFLCRRDVLHSLV